MSLASVLSLCACGGKPSDTSNGDFSTAPEKNPTFKFNEIENTCLVNEKIHDYVDKLKFQY